MFKRPWVLTRDTTVILITELNIYDSKITYYEEEEEEEKEEEREREREGNI